MVAVEKLPAVNEQLVLGRVQTAGYTELDVVVAKDIYRYGLNSIG